MPVTRFTPHRCRASDTRELPVNFFVKRFCRNFARCCAVNEESRSDNTFLLTLLGSGCITHCLPIPYRAAESLRQVKACAIPPRGMRCPALPAGYSVHAPATPESDDEIRS